MYETMAADELAIDELPAAIGAEIRAIPDCYRGEFADKLRDVLNQMRASQMRAYREKVNADGGFHD